MDILYNYFTEVLQQIEDVDKDISPRKTVVVIVDALRESFIDGDFINHVGDYTGYRMKLFKNLKEEYGDRLRMFTSIADMPTVTNQRIKSLSAGILPSLFDMGGNIGYDEAVIEDSIIHQARHHNKIIRMYGDDFWVGQYPTGFDEYEIFPSLDVTDLDSNDNIVEKRTLEQLEERDDWDILWTHVLGIDHAGHTFNKLAKSPLTNKQGVNK